MASGNRKKSKGASALAAARADVVGRRQIPWLTIISVGAIVALAAVVFGYYIVKSAPQRDQASREEQAKAFTPSAKNHDPSKKIPGIVIKTYKHRGHVKPNQRVAYDSSPPMGGPHDAIWADCMGHVYDQAVRNENMVHPLEHGTVWIAYNPKKLDSDGIDKLRARVKNKPYTDMSPYPTLDKPISLQAWGHQLKLSNPDDQRIDDFIAALRQNPYTTPEDNASCQAAPGFDVNNPPKFDPSKPGKKAVPLTYDGNAGSGMGGAAPSKTKGKK